MERLTSTFAMRAWGQEARRAGRSVGFVPTMGALHEGHLSLVQAARRTCDLVVASVFVNPLQFAPHEDFERYPRDVEGDARMLAGAGCDALFTVAREAMYPPGYATYIVQEGPCERLEGVERPGHFRGVLTVVLKLFQIVRPSVACFGHKDFQQTVVVRRMVRDLDLEVDVQVEPTVREADGLAMSSRNRYLSAPARLSAAALPRALGGAARAFAAGERRASALGALLREALASDPSIAIEYAVAVDPETLLEVDPLPEGAVALIAARVGGTRLIDNTPLATPDLPRALWAPR